MISVDKFYSIALLILLLFSETELWRYTVFVAIPFLVVLLLSVKQISVEFFNFIVPLALLLLISIISSLLNLNLENTYFVLRDGYYFIQPIIYILIGSILYLKIDNIEQLLKIFIVSSFIVTVYKISPLILNPDLLLSISIESRDEKYYNRMAIFSVAIILYSRANHFSLLKRLPENIILLLSLISVLISFTRSIYLALFFIMILLIVRKIKTIKILFNANVLFILIILFSSSLLISDSNIFTPTNTDSPLLSKTLNSLNEVVIRDYNSNAKRLTNWRGFEAFLGLKKYNEGNYLQLMFGHGLGTVVYNPIEALKKTAIGIIPIFHNGYVTVLLKSGIIGLFLYLIWLNKILFLSKVISSSDKDNFLSLMLRSYAFVLVLFTFVVQGIYVNTSTAYMLILLGVLIQAKISLNSGHRSGFKEK